MEMVGNETRRNAVKHEGWKALVADQQAERCSLSGEGVQHERTWKSLLSCHHV